MLMDICQQTYPEASDTIIVFTPSNKFIPVSDTGTFSSALNLECYSGQPRDKLVSSFASLNSPYE
jgi:hypothetical protein